MQQRTILKIPSSTRSRHRLSLLKEETEGAADVGEEDEEMEGAVVKRNAKGISRLSVKQEESG